MFSVYDGLSASPRLDPFSQRVVTITMRGLHKKGKNGPGLTGVQRVINTRERVGAVEDPCKVQDACFVVNVQQ